MYQGSPICISFERSYCCFCHLFQQLFPLMKLSIMLDIFNFAQANFIVEQLYGSMTFPIGFNSRKI